MSREYHFHRDHAGHSVTVTVRLGGTREIELLVNGKEVGFEREPDHREATRALHAELPQDPPIAFTVRVDLPARAQGAPTCTMELGTQHWPMGAAMPS